MSITNSHQGNAFHDFERSGWRSNVFAYEASFERLTIQATEPLLMALSVGKAMKLLDIATGPGFVAAAAAALGATVTGVDFSEPMIQQARQRNTGIDFQVGDAESLSFEDQSFDAVSMSFGILHLAQPERAVIEAARVLRPGGKVAFTAWAGPDLAVGFGIMLNAIQAHGNPDVDLPKGPPFFRFSQEAEWQKVLTEAELTHIEVIQIPLMWSFADFGDLFDAIYQGGVRIRAILRAQSAPVLAAIRSATSDAAKAYLHDGVIKIPMPAILAVATKTA